MWVLWVKNNYTWRKPPDSNIGNTGKGHSTTLSSRLKKRFYKHGEWRQGSETMGKSNSFTINSTQVANIQQLLHTDGDRNTRQDGHGWPGPGLLFPKELLRLDLLPLLLVGRLLLPARGAAGGMMTAGGTLPSLVYKDSISCFWRLCRSWISLRCLQKITKQLKNRITTSVPTRINMISPSRTGLLTNESVPQMHLI